MATDHLLSGLVHDPALGRAISQRLVLVGPHASIRRALFRRLILGMGSLGTKPFQGGPLARGCFESGDASHELVDLPEFRIDEIGPAYAKHGFIALCTDPFEEGCEEGLLPFIAKIKLGIWKSHCLVLISESGHLPESIEMHFKRFLERMGAKTRVFRVNCGDRASPELFVKLLLSAKDNTR